MKIQDAMVNMVEVIESGESVQNAALTMLEHDIGFLPVSRDEKLVGVITDRDIAVRVVATGLIPSETPVEDAMTKGVKYCYEDDDTDYILGSRTDIAVCRLPVMSRDKRLVGVVSIDSIVPQSPSAAASSP